MAYAIANKLPGKGGKRIYISKMGLSFKPPKIWKTKEGAMKGLHILADNCGITVLKCCEIVEI